MNDMIEMRKQAKALDPNTMDYAYIRIKQPQILFFDGIYYEVGVFKVKTKDAALNEHKEVCPTNKDGSLRPPFIAYDHPLMHELLNFAFNDIGVTDSKTVRANNFQRLLFHQLGQSWPSILAGKLCSVHRSVRCTTHSSGPSRSCNPEQTNDAVRHRCLHQ